jgi:hypothetical protein
MVNEYPRRSLTSLNIFSSIATWHEEVVSIQMNKIQTLTRSSFDLDNSMWSLLGKSAILQKVNTNVWGK